MSSGCYRKHTALRAAASRGLQPKPARAATSAAAVAKRRFETGTRSERGIGGFEVCGEAARVYEARGHVPIGVLQFEVLRRRVEPGEGL